MISTPLSCFYVNISSRNILESLALIHSVHSVVCGLSRVFLDARRGLGSKTSAFVFILCVVLNKV